MMWEAKMAGMYIDCREKPVPQRVPESADLGNPAMRTHFAGFGASARLPTS